MITAKKVQTSARSAVLPSIFGGAGCTVIESAIFDVAGAIIQGYAGAYWEFFKLDNGGFYMAPCIGAPVKLQDCGNMWEGEVSDEVAGIICCLHAYSHTSFAARDGSDFQQALAAQFHLLRDFALDHPNAREIFGAID